MSKDVRYSRPRISNIFAYEIPHDVLFLVLHFLVLLIVDQYSSALTVGILDRSSPNFLHDIVALVASSNKIKPSYHLANVQRMHVVSVCLHYGKINDFRFGQAFSMSHLYRRVHAYNHIYANPNPIPNRNFNFTNPITNHKPNPTKPTNPKLATRNLRESYNPIIERLATKILSTRLIIRQQFHTDL